MKPITSKPFWIARDKGGTYNLANEVMRWDRRGWWYNPGRVELDDDNSDLTDFLSKVGVQVARGQQARVRITVERVSE